MLLDSNIVIAGTALAHGLTLITRNSADFNWIEGLALLDPLIEEQG